MKSSILIDLLQNTAVLLVLAMLYENFWLKKKNSKSMLNQIVTGFAIAVIGILLMFTPWIFIPGIQFDLRSVLLANAGLFFGTIPTLIAMAILALARIIIGGSGIWMGLAVIFCSGIIGLLWRKYRSKWLTKKSVIELFLLGLTVHIAMLADTLILPKNIGMSTFQNILLPVVFIYIPATVLLGFLMLKQTRNHLNSLAQLKLQESERRFTQVLESGNFISIILDLNGNVKFCNAYCLQLTGYSDQEVMGNNWFSLFIPDDQRTVLQNYLLKDLSHTVLPNVNENEICTKSGKKLLISWYNIPLISVENTTNGMASIGVNITEARNYEHDLEEKNATIEQQNEVYKILNQELILAKEKAEESDRLKSAFLANMSHEIRTPMNGILGFTELLKTPNLEGEQQAEFIKIIEKSGVRMLNIVNDIIDISKIESGAVELNIAAANINEQLNFIYNFFKPEMDAKNLHFHCNKTLSNENSIQHTDKEKLYAILTNLVKNAIKFTEEGKIEFGYTYEQSPLGDDDKLLFYVKDTGVGIACEQKEMVFERFRQGSESLTRNYEGAGLGLAISKAYIEALGGNIWVESELNQGTSFFFTLPYKKIETQKSAEKAVGKVEQSLKPIKKLNILIVEDDETSASYLSLIVTKYAKSVVTFTNGEEAVSYCLQNKDIDLILMDIKMPQMNGYEAVSQIRSFNPEVKIIAQTAFALTGDREKTLASGFNDYIAKPIKQEVLIQMIENLGSN